VTDSVTETGQNLAPLQQPRLVYMQYFIEIVLCVPCWESFEKLFVKLF